MTMTEAPPRTDAIEWLESLIVTQRRDLKSLDHANAVHGHARRVIIRGQIKMLETHLAEHKAQAAEVARLTAAMDAAAESSAERTANSESHLAAARAEAERYRVALGRAATALGYAAITRCSPDGLINLKGAARAAEEALAAKPGADQDGGGT